MDKVNKKFRAMICPVCDGMFFSGPRKDSYDKDMEEYVNGEVRCSHCGWIYDLLQADNPDSQDGFNKMSVNEYKQWFTNKIKENPNYDYLEENLPQPTPHKCPVCGEYEFADKLSSDICPICGWEDTGYEETPNEKPSEFMMSLNERKQWFTNKRKNNPKYKYKNDK